MLKKCKIVMGVLTILICVLIGCNQGKKQDELLTISKDELIPGEELIPKEEPSVKEQAAVEQIQGEITKQAGETPKPEPPKKCVVHICGEVRNPGVYTLQEGSRVFEAIEAAGALTETAAGDYLNQADFLTDGMKIYVPSLQEIEEKEKAEPNIKWEKETTLPANKQEKQDMGAKTSGPKVNINQADEAMLCTIPGIGNSKAKKIIAYRQENGAYTCIEDIMKVGGIKTGMFEKIKDFITI